MLASIGKRWQALASVGKHWQALASIGKHWQALASVGKCWQALVSIGKHWQALARQLFVFANKQIKDNQTLKSPSCKLLVQILALLPHFLTLLLLLILTHLICPCIVVDSSL